MTAESVRIQVIVSKETKSELDQQAAQDGLSLSAVAWQQRRSARVSG